MEQVAGLEAQEAVLAATGWNKLFTELDFVREGDTLVVKRIDRLARSTADPLGIVATMEAKRVALRWIDICHETVRHWRNRFGPMFATDIRHLRVWRMRGFPHWYWRLVCA